MIRLATAGGLVKLEAGGAADRTVEFDGAGVRSLADGWAVLDDGSVVSPDGTAVGSGFDGLRPWCIAIEAGGDTALVGTSEARLFRAAPDGGVEAVMSFDQIPTRDDWYTPWGAPPDTRSVAVTPDGEVMVNVHVGGIWAGRPDGGGWEPVVEVDADVHQVAAAPEGRVVAAAAAIGCGVSLDGGRRWVWSDEGLHASYARAVALAGDVVLVSASTGPSSRSGALYRRALTSAEPFERCRDGLPESFPFNLDTFSVAANGHEVVLGTDDGRLFRSTDQGRSWERLADDLPAIRAVELT
ncbi:MAG: WD40/YVTN/BNR-like repeat-containing protein [Acidimicrobiales bacterium]